MKNTTIQSILEQAGGFITWRGKTCRLRRHRPRPQIGNATIGRQEVENPGILHGLTIREKLSELGPVSVGREINFPTTDGWCGQNTHSHNTFVHVQVMRTLPAQMFDSHTTRTRVAQAHSAELHALVPQKVVVIHAQCPAYMPHLPRNTSTRSLSPTSTTFLPSSPSRSCPTSAPWGLDQDTLRDPRRSGGYT